MPANVDGTHQADVTVVTTYARRQIIRLVFMGLQSGLQFAEN